MESSMAKFVEKSNDAVRLGFRMEEKMDTKLDEEKAR